MIGMFLLLVHSLSRNILADHSTEVGISDVEMATDMPTALPNPGTSEIPTAPKEPTQESLDARDHRWVL